MVGLSELAEGRVGQTPLVTALNVAGLGLLVWGVIQQGHLGLSGAHLAATLLLVSAVTAWFLWLGTRSTGAEPVARVGLLAMAAAGGALAAFAPIGLVFVAVAALGSSIRWSLTPALFITGAGALAMVTTVAATGHTYGVFFGGLAASSAGLVMGTSRRQSIEVTRQAALLEVETERAELERARAALLADRNHLARELHDVLAHTLAAVSVQLEALDTVIGVSRPDPALHESVAKLRGLVHEGLSEARGAVRALREDAPPLREQLRRLCGDQDVSVLLDREPEGLSPQASLSLYRIAQEALTNAVKHAPGAAVTLRLEVLPEKVVLRVENGPSAGRTELAASGGGFGLQGIAERVAMLGGHLEAGPTEEGWRVVAEVPVPA